MSAPFSPLSAVPMREGQKTPLELVKAMCKRMGYDVREVRGESRVRRYVMFRTEMAESLRLCGFSYPAIGHALNRDHSTVMWILGRTGRIPHWKAGEKWPRARGRAA